MKRGIISWHYLGEQQSEVRRRFSNHFGSTLSLLIHQRSLNTYLEDEKNKKKRASALDGAVLMKKQCFDKYYHNFSEPNHAQHWSRVRRHGSV